MASDRPHDVVLFGATGFTGALTAEELVTRAPEGTKLALAGRNPDKLAALRDRLAERVPAAARMPLLHADAEDAASLREVAESTHVVATTVGPYVHHGDPLVAACAAAGTDYADLTGEPEFVDRTYVRHHATAVASGARLVHACGFDSIPHDLGVQFTVEQLPEGVPLTVEGFVRAGGTFSAGTYHSAVTAFSRARHYAKVSVERRRLEPRPEGRRVRGLRGVPRREHVVDAWAVPFPTIDPQIVLRSARALERYGPDFSYGHYVAVKRLPVAVGGVAGVASLFALAQVPPARDVLLGRMRSGEGPDEEQRRKGWFAVRFAGRAEGGRRVVTEVTGGDPGYGETAKMLAESALCLASDDLPPTAGQVTTAVAMGPALRERLQRAGIAFSVVERS
jgi:saccharopine dehydrogenase (NAD+, L-glutamate forming)